MAAAFLAFVGAKGGAGTSTLCVELAKALREETNVTLVDADLSGRRSLGILTDAVRYLDAERAQRSQHVAQARVQGFTLLELAESYESPFTLSASEIESAAASIAGNGIVLVDLPLPFTANVRPFVVRASRFVVVTEPSLLGVTAAKSLISQMLHFGIPKNRIALAVTARSAGQAIKRAEIERMLDAPVLAEIPPSNDRNFARAIAQLQREIARVAPEPTLHALLASDSGEVRDRRANKRREEAAADVALPALPRAGIDPTPQSKVKAAIHEALAKQIDLLDAAKVQGDAAKLAELRSRIAGIADDILKTGEFAGSAETVAQIKQDVVNEALGFGPIDEYLHHPDVTEIMVNGPNDIYVEMAGIIHKTHKHFSSEAQLRLVIERIIAPLGRRVDESVPMVDARLRDGSRVNAIIEPVSLNGATITIRRFGNKRLTADDLVAKESVTPEVLDFLRACVEARLNMVISGGTGSGKTTFLNVLSSFLPRKERIITIEDAAELLLNQPHVVRLESRPPNLEGRGEITIRDLVRNALRMRPDRIVVGEARGPEALDMLQAMNTGHDGSLTTIHANTSRDALSRIETMVLMSGFDLPVRAIREQVSSAINLVVQTARLRDGSRKVTAVSEIIGMEGDTVTMHDIVRFVQHGLDENDRVLGEYQYMGVQPVALQRFAEYGIPFDLRKLSSLTLASHAW
ncbi:MAG TPA: ATPase, T2SS/T4P/T4SS family, partial [Candidatus Baltobacteraceae bacterium]|nr:ATPase, T2SS/T4P/T4SS family [Candidatus Baltobacteraceae bacterium]